MPANRPSQPQPIAAGNRRIRIGLPLIACILIAGVTLTALATRSFNKGARVGPAGAAQPGTLQAGPAALNRLRSRLALQPEADHMRHRLGQRFLAAGREIATLTGTLLIGAQSRAVQIVRGWDEAGERLTIAFNGGPPVLSWSAADGATAGGPSATGGDRLLIERIALDSPDQFVLAQLRGASYFNIAWGVKPAEAGSSDDYAGPLWNLVRVGEPQDSVTKPQSLARVYYVNTATGLIDKIVSEEQGEVVEARLSGWVSQGGERTPTLIQWVEAGRVVMSLSLNNAAYGPAQ